MPACPVSNQVILLFLREHEDAGLLTEEAGLVTAFVAGIPR